MKSTSRQTTSSTSSDTEAQLRAVIEDRKRVETLLAGKNQLLEMTAAGQPLERVLGSICTLVETIAGDCLCSILLVDTAHGRVVHGAAPNLPDSFNEAIHGRSLDSESGPCATAATLNHLVISTDIASEPRWRADHWCELALAHGLRSCCSSPVVASTGAVVGTFAIYTRQPGEPTALHLDLIAHFTHLASLAIERAQFEQALRNSEKLARDQASTLTSTLDLLANETDANRLVEHILRALTEQLDAFGCSVWRREGDSDRVAFQFAFEDGRLVTSADAGIATLSPTLRIDEVWPWPRVFRNAEAELLRDIQAGPDFPWREHVLQLGIRSILVMPMLISGRVEGVIGIRFQQLREFSPEEIELAQALANQSLLAMQLTLLTAHSRETAIVNERNRMAREIHDTLAQGLTGVIVQLEASEDARARGLGMEADQHLGRAGLLARQSLQEARRSVFALRPRALGEKQFAEVLRETLQSMLAGTAVGHDFRLLGEPCELPESVEDNLLRIAQEAMANAVRHAAAECIELSLTFGDGLVRLEVQDDGRGFDHNKSHDGFGLVGMRERAGLIGAQFALCSVPSQGTCVQVELRTATPRSSQ